MPANQTPPGDQTSAPSTPMGATTVRVAELAMPVSEGPAPLEALRGAVRKIAPAEAQEALANPETMRIARRALDTRQRDPRFVFTVELDLPAAVAAEWCANHPRVTQAPSQLHTPLRLHNLPDGPRPVVVGAGPAGLFAAYTLALTGWPPLVLERGKPVEERGRDVSRLYSRGELNPESNVCYGEGGAGTYSDGKLYTRVRDPRGARVMRAMVEHGADPDILINTRPHLGTDRLVKWLKTMRRQLEHLGVTFCFSSKVSDFATDDDGQLQHIRCADGSTIDAHHAVVATGHSARGVWRALQQAGAQLELRPFAVGFRVEHPQAFVDQAQYRAHAGKGDLPAADYRLHYQDRLRGSDRRKAKDSAANKPGNDGSRGVYSFCMCPGGVVVTTPTRPEALCINGMSHAARSGRFANSAMVVTVGPEDFAAAGFGTDVYAGEAFQTAIEEQAYAMGSGAFMAPAARVSDFMRQVTSSSLPNTSYRRGITPGPIWDLYPKPVTEALQRGLRHFDRRMRGFVTDDAVLIGVETRTASPVRVLRDETNGSALGIGGLYPAGEGMGYGGGILSAAIDGMRAAEHLLQSVGATSDAP